MRWCQLSLFADAHVYWKKRKRKSKIALFHHRTSMMKVSYWYPYLRQATKFGNFAMLFQKDGNFIYHNLLDPVQPFFAIKWTNSSGKFSIHRLIYHESMIKNYYSFFSFLSGVNSNASSQALPNSLPVTTPTIR